MTCLKFPSCICIILESTLLFNPDFPFVSLRFIYLILAPLTKSCPNPIGLVPLSYPAVYLPEP